MIPSPIEFMYFKNRIGPSTDPCGTPLMTGAHSEKLSLNTTLCFLSVKNEVIHSRVFPLIPYLEIVFTSFLWGTLSKVFWKLM